jgi:hypothetical protein
MLKQERELSRSISKKMRLWWVWMMVAEGQTLTLTLTLTSDLGAIQFRAGPRQRHAIIFYN